MTRRAALTLALVALALALAGCGIDDRSAHVPGSTLQATVADPDGDGDVGRGPGEPLVDRTDLAPRGSAADEVARFGQVTDTHVRDEESPARVPFLDRLGAPVTSTFRPQEAMSAQVLNAALRAMTAERPRGVLLTGDLLDNAQRNELDQLLAVVEGGTVDPDSGDLGYDGVQSAENPDGFFYRPDLDAPRLPGLLRRAQEPFFATGVRVPWYPALGNHDVLVQGEQPPSQSIDAIATGDRALLTFDPDLADRIDADLAPTARTPSPDLRGIPRQAIAQLLADGVPSAEATTVPADARRRVVRARELVAALERGSGVRSRAPDRLEYVADIAPGVRAIVLDTATRSGGARGSLEPGQIAFLRRELGRAGDRAIVVVDHHGLERVAGGRAAIALLDDDPRVVAELRGDRHRNEVRPVRTSAGGYWRITTSSLADWPQQGRMLRLVTGPDGSRALETWMVDHAGALSARDLAGAARQLSHDDAQGGRPGGLAGTRTDRNVRLWLPPLGG
jgi:3',5'-cyclic AMP phosphodiesterase CpdA